MPELPLAAVLLAQSASPSRLAAAVDVARAAGARPVVVVLSREAPAPADVRVARVSDGAPAIGALRAGMALLTNTPARLALVWPLRDEADSEASIAMLVDAARREGAMVTARAGADLDRAPVIVARDAWLELVTLGEQGLGAVAARRGMHEVARHG